MRSSVVLLIALFALSTNLQAQKRKLPRSYRYNDPTVSVGIGMGLDYGGFGTRLSAFPSHHLEVFGSAGYAFSGVGYNVGGAFRLTPDKQATPTLGFMYGYTAAIKVFGDSRYDKLYYGPSASVGFQMRGSHKSKNFLNIELVLPFRPQAYYDDINAIKNNTTIKINKLLPFAFSIGYHFGF